MCAACHVKVQDLWYSAEVLCTFSMTSAMNTTMRLTPSRRPVSATCVRSYILCTCHQNNEASRRHLQHGTHTKYRWCWNGSSQVLVHVCWVGHQIITVRLTWQAKHTNTHMYTSNKGEYYWEYDRYIILEAGCSLLWCETYRYFTAIQHHYH